MRISAPIKSGLIEIVKFNLWTMKEIEEYMVANW